MESAAVEIRGHHLFILFYCFSGKNREVRIKAQVRAIRKRFGKKTGENDERVLRRILNDPQAKIKLVVTADGFCEDCFKADERCRSTKAKRVDRAFIKAFGCEANEIYSLNELMKRGYVLIEAYRKELPLKRGRPKMWVAIGSHLDRFKDQ